jgi:hypothetical protein
MTLATRYEQIPGRYRGCVPLAPGAAGLGVMAMCEGAMAFAIRLRGADDAISGSGSLQRPLLTQPGQPPLRD